MLRNFAPAPRLRLRAWVCVTLLAGCSRQCAGSGQTASAPPEASLAAASSRFALPLPGAPPPDSALAQRLAAKWAARARRYVPRTRHLEPDGSPKYTNRLFLESSPYLLQHAHNPVNWYPWGDEAFREAQRRNVPVFLSVGYSTCHWCHVMEEESFEDETIARELNENFVAIKVDREERPDVDAIYMQAVELLAGGGGWPMSVWLTPERKPFYGGTYFQPRPFGSLLGNLARLYHEQPDSIFQSAARLADEVRGQLDPAETSSDALPPASLLNDAAARSGAHFDPAYGGLAGAPKFPRSLPIRFLLRHSRRSGNARSLAMATWTLEKMAAGGIHDQIGGGFHRYSTDARWLVPHFEKMLYDNALLAMDYLAGYQATGREDFANVARDILRYVARDMMSPEGAFYSATDADSPAPDGRREEGRFFTWTPPEIEAVLGKDRARIVNEFYGISANGNFDGRSVLSAASPPADVAARLAVPVEQVASVLRESRELLYEARAKRAPPARDEKVLTAWNGLMISAYAQAALVLGDPSDAERAVHAAEFVLANLRSASSSGGTLYRSFKDGSPHHDGYLDDYAFFIAGLLDLFEATGEARWLREAVALDQVLTRRFEDPSGGFFLTSAGEEELFARDKPSSDGAEPSGNSVEAMNLLRLREFEGPEGTFGERADATLRAFQKTWRTNPLGLSEMLMALDFRYDSPKEIVIVSPSSRQEASAFLDVLRTTYLPNRALSVVTHGPDQEAVAELVPAVREKTARDGRATAYVCEGQTCRLPTTDPRVFAAQVRTVRPLP